MARHYREAKRARAEMPDEEVDFGKLGSFVPHWEICSKNIILFMLLASFANDNENEIDLDVSSDDAF